MTVKKAVYKVDNGSGFDDIFFKTSEDMIVNQVQSLGKNGYRKLPGGVILQWGFYMTPSGGHNDSTEGIYYKYINNLSLPTSFTNSDFCFLAFTTNARNWAFGAANNRSSVNLGCANILRASQNDRLGIYWFAIGH
ncbi:gp53-like domain-containing protein [Clostridium oceanicum]|uniref:Putative tail fiber protein gp53-like C-terminal domain-containing protein n=1 Tax=Clostridium oceanicum TaxID=1543 RepID=A0ABN1JCB6_9CLOT